MENVNQKFSNLSKLSFGDAGVKAKLIDTFFATAEKIVFSLEQAITNKDNASWRNFSHELKSMCANLGAYNLYNLSLESEKSFNATEDLKRSLLGKITRNLALLKK